MDFKGVQNDSKIRGPGCIFPVDFHGLRAKCAGFGRQPAECPQRSPARHDPPLQRPFMKSLPYATSEERGNPERDRVFVGLNLTFRRRLLP
jgi:hypothetical protein